MLHFLSDVKFHHCKPCNSFLNCAELFLKKKHFKVENGKKMLDGDIQLLFMGRTWAAYQSRTAWVMAFFMGREFPHGAIYLIQGAPKVNPHFGAMNDGYHTVVPSFPVACGILEHIIIHPSSHTQSLFFQNWEATVDFFFCFKFWLLVGSSCLLEPVKNRSCFVQMGYPIFSGIYIQTDDA